MIIRNFTSSLGIHNQQNKTNSNLSKTLEKLSSGYRINRAGDDAARLAISEKLKMSITESEAVLDNIGQGINVTQTADAALQEVNDMIIRATELTTLAGNETYTQVERDAIALEVRALYDEMERIFDSTYFNTIPLFKLDGYYNLGTDLGTYNYDEFTYAETITPLDEVGFILDSEIAGLVSKDFDQPSEPVNASVSMQLDSYLLENPADMVGKSFTTGYLTYTVSEADLAAGTGGDGSIDIQAVLAATVERTVNSASSSYTILLDHELVEVSEEGEVSFGYLLNDYSQSLILDGNNTIYNTDEVDGAKANGSSLTSTNVNDFTSIDMFPYASPTYTTDADSASVRLMSSYANSYVLSDAEIENLMRNTLQVGPSSNTIALSDLLYSGITAGALRQSIYDTIENMDGYTVSGSPSSFTVTYDTKTTSNSSTLYVKENTQSADTTTLTDSVSVGSIGVTSTVTQSASQESGEIVEYSFSIPADDPFCVTINGTNYTFITQGYLEGDPDFLAANPDFTFSNASNNNNIIISDTATDDDILALIATRMSSAVGSNATVTTADGKITVTSNVANTSLSQTISSGRTSLTHYMYYKSVNEEASSAGLGISTVYFYKDMDIDIDLSSVFPDGFDVDNLSDLDNVAFTIGSYTYYFNGSGTDFEAATHIYSNYRQINVSSATSMESLATLIKNAMYSPSPSRVTMGEDGSFTLEYDNISSGSQYSINEVVNPNLGLFSGYDDDGNPIFDVADDSIEGDLGYIQSNTAEGGELIGHPLTELDFSSYDASNIGDLLGKGFTITCSTCCNEKNSFIFVNDSSDLTDLSNGDYTDEFGNTVSINTYPIELSILDFTSPDTIVQSIIDNYNAVVSQHTLEFTVDPENPSVLIIQDRRAGTMEGHVPTIETGVYGSYSYSVEKTPVEPDVGDGDEDPPVEEELDESTWQGALKIFVDSEREGDDQFIFIDLPYLDGEKLDIESPKPILDSVQEAMEENAKLRALTQEIALYRADIGADQKRLEHAFQVVNVTLIEESSSLSVMRDANIALEMMKYVKDNILIEAQNAMMSHSFQDKQAILTLMQ